ncbi:ComF family protein [Neptunomonas sp. XY-337]|uniref:ComF family protein n=1 Tax=Neptunomonas sp. XY-337 TaxID=2561897 RepID=UPI0010A9FE9F|nr:ComF family protein [Neptunomonas sp. XY-337]
MESKKKNSWFIFNQSCMICQRHSPDSVCSHCQQELPWSGSSCYRCAIGLDITVPRSLCQDCRALPPHFDHCHAAFEYRFPVNQLLKRAKHLAGANVLRTLARCLASSLLEQPQNWPDALVPVPLHQARQLKRGFNQAELIAKQLSTQLGIPLLADRLVRQTPTFSQAKLSARARRANLHSSFSLQHALPRHVALIDDVMTTGSTANTISEYLKSTGVERVDVWVIARTPTPRQM